MNYRCLSNDIRQCSVLLPVNHLFSYKPLNFLCFRWAYEFTFRSHMIRDDRTHVGRVKDFYFYRLTMFNYIILIKTVDKAYNNYTWWCQSKTTWCLLRIMLWCQSRITWWCQSRITLWCQSMIMLWCQSRITWWCQPRATWKFQSRTTWRYQSMIRFIVSLGLRDDVSLGLRDDVMQSRTYVMMSE